MEGSPLDRLNKYVWAKIPDHHSWPGITITGTGSYRRLVYCFGTHEFHWIKHYYILPYMAYREKFHIPCVSPLFEVAIHEIEEHITKTLADDDYEVPIETENTDASSTVLAIVAGYREKKGQQLTANEAISRVVQECITNNLNNHDASAEISSICDQIYKS